MCFKQLASTLLVLVNFVFAVSQSVSQSLHTYPLPPTHPFNGPFSGTTRVSLYQKGKTNLDFIEARDSEWQWHHLGHMQRCAPRSRQTIMPAPHRSVFTGRMPSLPPNQQRQSTEGKYPPHLKYAATLPCNLSLIACSVDINVSQGNLAAYARCGGILNIRFTANLPWNLSVKKIVNRLRFDRIMVMSLWPRFWPTLYVQIRHVLQNPHTPHRSATRLTSTLQGGGGGAVRLSVITPPTAYRGAEYCDTSDLYQIITKLRKIYC